VESTKPLTNRTGQAFAGTASPATPEAAELAIAATRARFNRIATATLSLVRNWLGRGTVGPYRG